MMVAIIPYTIYVHKTGDKLLLARQAHDSIQKDYEFIEATKYLFREFIGSVIQYHASIDGLTEMQYDKLMKQAYQKSDFDWKDKKRLLEFGDWYFGDLNSD